MIDETYSLSVITKFLTSNNIPYEHCNAKVGMSFYDHGCRVKLNEQYSLSIQTHPDIAGESFAETALQDMVNKKIVYSGKFSYHDVKHFKDPQELFDHITDLVATCKNL